MAWHAHCLDGTPWALDPLSYVKVIQTVLWIASGLTACVSSADQGVASSSKVDPHRTPSEVVIDNPNIRDECEQTINGVRESNDSEQVLEGQVLEILRSNVCEIAEGALSLVQLHYITGTASETYRMTVVRRPLGVSELDEEVKGLNINAWEVTDELIFVAGSDREVENGLPQWRVETSSQFLASQPWPPRVYDPESPSNGRAEIDVETKSVLIGQVKKFVTEHLHGLEP